VALGSHTRRSAVELVKALIKNKRLAPSLRLSLVGAVCRCHGLPLPKQAWKLDGFGAAVPFDVALSTAVANPGTAGLIFVCVECATFWGAWRCCEKGDHLVLLTHTGGTMKKCLGSLNTCKPFPPMDAPPSLSLSLSSLLPSPHLLFFIPLSLHPTSPALSPAFSLPFSLPPDFTPPIRFPDLKLLPRWMHNVQSPSP
jgi:hypothetical protein